MLPRESTGPSFLQVLERQQVVVIHDSDHEHTQHRSPRGAHGRGNTIFFARLRNVAAVRFFRPLLRP